MKKFKISLKHLRLILLFAVAVFLILSVTMALSFLCIHLLARFGILNPDQIHRVPLLMLCLISTVLGTILALFCSRILLHPIRDIMDATDRIADGDYRVRIHLHGPEDFQVLSDKFNHMAEELSSVEMLRSDFVSNFSHEFKTPIVSIRGFAKALKWDDLTPEDREEYLNIIINESERLSDLSTNVLYLSRLENQTILTDKKPFNITEQIRLVIALLDHKICEKELQICFEGEDYSLSGNAEMLKQIWINLLDNAVKFSPAGGTISVHVDRKDTQIEVSVSNQGEGLSPETSAHIFDRFYQGDLSHSTPGNGLGLTIAGKIAELHKGTIRVDSSIPGWITFVVQLPIE